MLHGALGSFLGLMGYRPLPEAPEPTNNASNKTTTDKRRCAEEMTHGSLGEQMIPVCGGYDTWQLSIKQVLPARAKEIYTDANQATNVRAPENSQHHK